MAVLYLGEEVAEEDDGANATLKMHLREHGFTPIMAGVL